MDKPFNWVGAPRSTLQYEMVIARPPIGGGRPNRQFAPVIQSGPASVVNRSSALTVAGRNGITINPNATVVLSGNLLLQVRPGSRIVTAIGFTPQTNTAAIMDSIVFRKGLPGASDSTELIPGYTMGEYRNYQNLARELEKAQPNSGYARQTARELTAELLNFERAMISAFNEGPRAIFDPDSGRIIESSPQEQARLRESAEKREKERARYQCIKTDSVRTYAKPNGQVQTVFAAAVAAHRDGNLLFSDVTNFVSVRASIGKRIQTAKEDSTAIASASVSITGYRQATTESTGVCVIRNIGELQAVPR
jgi:hypothetical protein